jgi:uncharacterized protein with von Willebrand factor type A (vWA) domain
MVAIRMLRPAVETPETLVVVTGTRDESLDSAIDRLAIVQDAKRQLVNEEKPLREAAEFCLRRHGVDHYTAPSGHTATLYSSTRTEWDAKYLESVLTPEQLKQARKSKTVQAMRVA